MKNSHLTLEDRKKIQEGLENELSRTEIAKILTKIFLQLQKKLKVEEN